jgi:hypothetical protein
VPDPPSLLHFDVVDLRLSFQEAHDALGMLAVGSIQWVIAHDVLGGHVNYYNDPVKCFMHWNEKVVTLKHIFLCPPVHSLRPILLKLHVKHGRHECPLLVLVAKSALVVNLSQLKNFQVGIYRNIIKPVVLGTG